MRISLIGVGSMGGALLAGWMATGRDPDDVTVAVRRQEQADDLHARYGVRNVSLDEALQADVVVLAVKPHQIEDVLAGRTPKEGAIVCSVAAGLTTARLESLLPAGTAVVRVMPNTAATEGESMSGIVAGQHATDDHVAAITELFDAVGATMVVPEQQLDALTAISGSGPAYLFYVAEAMTEAGVHQGLTRAQSAELVAQTFLGAAHLLATGESPTALREAVTSPGGTTAAALRRLDDHGVRAAFLDAVEACRKRAQEMGD